MAACGGDLVGSPQQMHLPETLREVSGLVAIDESRLLAIADEVGVVYELDFETGRISERHQFGEPVVRADFEGLALADGVIYALTSNGTLYSSRGAVIGTGLGRFCELEGLVKDPANRSLWLLCKEPRKKKQKKKLHLYNWDLERGDFTDRTLSVAYADLGVKKNLRPSALDFLPSGEEIMVLAARQQAYVIINLRGELMDGGLLPNRRLHPQAEGLAIVGETVYVADEGVDGPATVTRYENGF